MPSQRTATTRALSACTYHGHVKSTSLDGLTLFVVVHFPGTLHEGNDEAQPVMDERATPEQRDALFRIMSGKHSAEGTLFHIFSLIVTKMHDPLFAAITFDFDKEARTARVAAPGILESYTRPITNPITGLPHRIRVVMPEGFEHIEGEIASADIRSTGAIVFDRNWVLYRASENLSSNAVSAVRYAAPDTPTHIVIDELHDRLMLLVHRVLKFYGLPIHPISALITIYPQRQTGQDSSL